MEGAGGAPGEGAMFIPLHDDNRLDHIATPWVTRGLIVVNVLVYVIFQSGLVVDAHRASVAGFAVIPAEFNLAAGLRDTLAVIPEPLTLVTYMFLHGGWMHLGGNMLFLWVFGDNVEDAVGHLRFVAFYLVCGVAAGLTHAAVMTRSEAPLVGASGAVAGCMAAYLILHPRIRLWVLVLGRIPLRISAMWAIGAWIAWQVGNIVAGSPGNTAWWAHLGGLVAGAALIPVLRRPGVRLLDQAVSG